MNHVLPSLPDSLGSLLKDECIDWNDEYDFDHPCGPQKRFGGRSVDCMRPVPHVDPDIAIGACKSIDVAMTKASKKDFSVLIYRLSLQCGMRKMTEREVELYADDLWSDVCDYPLALIESACQRWRRSTEERTRFMPASGDFIALMADDFAKLRKLQKRAYRLTGKRLPVKKAENFTEAVTDMIRGVK